jgi:hypothetical protein
MTGFSLKNYAERELKYQARREISNEIRKNCPKGDPMVTGITVMLGTVLALAALNAIFNGSARDRTR